MSILFASTIGSAGGSGSTAHSILSVVPIDDIEWAVAVATNVETLTSEKAGCAKCDQKLSKTYLEVLG